MLPRAGDRVGNLKLDGLKINRRKMEKDLFALLETVIDEISFIKFLSTLEADWKKIGNDEWQNGTIGQFLEAAATWGMDSKDGLEFYKKPSNPWRRAADIMYMGKIFE
jgi:hypothetical protein